MRKKLDFSTDMLPFKILEKSDIFGIESFFLSKINIFEVVCVQEGKILSIKIPEFINLCK